MGFLKGKTSEQLKWLGLGFFFGGGALGMASTRIEDDVLAIAALMPCIIFLMLAIASLARSISTSLEASE